MITKIVIFQKIMNVAQDDESFLLKQFGTFSARDQGSILKRVHRELFLKTVLSSENPGAFLERAEGVKKLSKRRKKEADVAEAVEADVAEAVEAVEEEVGAGEPATPVKKSRKHGSHKCSNCHQKGHTKKTCKEIVAQKQSSPPLSVSQRIEALKKYL